jgi:hypothetical protein
VDGFGLKWALQSGVTPSFGTGPSRDHTTGTKEGSYIYLEYVFLVDLRVRGKVTFLESRFLIFKFWSLFGDLVKPKTVKSKVSARGYYGLVMGSSNFCHFYPS